MAVGAALGAGTTGAGAVLIMRVKSLGPALAPADGAMPPNVDKFPTPPLDPNTGGGKMDGAPESYDGDAAGADADGAAGDTGGAIGGAIGGEDGGAMGGAIGGGDNGDGAAMCPPNNGLTEGFCPCGGLPGAPYPAPEPIWDDGIDDGDGAALGLVANIFVNSPGPAPVDAAGGMSGCGIGGGAMGAAGITGVASTGLNTGTVIERGPGVGVGGGVGGGADGAGVFCLP